MQLHSVISVSKDGETYIAKCDLTDFQGERYICEYVVNENDNFGLAPFVRDAVTSWVAAANTVEVLLPAVAPVPQFITFPQLLIGLVTEAWITEAEGEAWLAGTLPFAVLTVIDGLPEGQRFAAKARALRPSEVLRNDPLVASMGTAAGKTAAEIDTFFQTYAQV